ncbi:hypothetical protein [Niabella hibiscisoli]|uniref:hypothetical protein n=1 Tax=Niabella hibiscisoli TaxID=1825928 RepID=UPI001F0E6A7B|nr:hypothetical protein [Niabella hibiscisoli]MCH5715866.1 hypothetical protein [Niabella hibiscisoli]
MNLGDAGRKSIKGQEIKYYIDRITEVREKTLRELKNKDDKWLMAIDKKWSNEKGRSTLIGSGFMFVSMSPITGDKLPG